MADKTKLTPLEFEVMNVIWDTQGNPTVRDIINTAYQDGKKAYTTIQTVMNNLVEKGFLSKEKTGLVNFYKVVVKKNDIVKKETDHFIKNVFSGSSLSLVNFLLGEDKLSDDEIGKLKKLIEKKENEG